MKYKKVPNNENAIEIDGKVVLSFDPRYKEYLKWRDENPGLEKKLVEELEQEIENKRLYNNGASHKIGNVHKWYDKGGRLTIESEMKGDKWHGRVIQYNENEIVVSRENYIDGVLDGKYKYYHENGNLRQSGWIKNHIKEGEIISYWENGNIQSIENFKMGIKHGKIDRYDISGELLMTGHCKNNYRHGNWTWYYTGGDMKMKLEVYELSELKKVIDWDVTGQKVSEAIKSNIGYDIWRNFTWYSSGVKKHDINYENSKLNGKWTEWYTNGVKRAEGNIKYEMMEGKWIFWYHNGQKELECEFDFGNPIDTAKIYHDNGVLKESVGI
jgi:antitoxin component YwqK of YwqJK toxin-antitoxin module